jgi:hypothetical protein
VPVSADGDDCVTWNNDPQPPAVLFSTLVASVSPVSVK